MLYCGLMGSGIICFGALVLAGDHGFY